MASKCDMLFTDSSNVNYSTDMDNRAAMGLPPAYSEINYSESPEQSASYENTTLPTPQRHQSPIAGCHAASMRRDRPRRYAPGVPTSTLNERNVSNTTVNVSMLGTGHSVRSTVISRNGPANACTVVSAPCRTVCPNCRYDGVYFLRNEYTWRTHTSALLLGIFGFCWCGCCLPYCINYKCKTFQYCGNCNMKLGNCN